MKMPKGQKSNYATLEPDSDGLDYRAIASKLSKEGYRLGHSTVRNVLIKLLERFAAAFMVIYDIKGDPAVVAREPGFQRALAELIHEAMSRIDQEKKDGN